MATEKFKLWQLTDSFAEVPAKNAKVILKSTQLTNAEPIQLAAFVDVMGSRDGFVVFTDRRVAFRVGTKTTQVMFSDIKAVNRRRRMLTIVSPGGSARLFSIVAQPPEPLVDRLYGLLVEIQGQAQQHGQPPPPMPTQQGAIGAPVALKGDHFAASVAVKQESGGPFIPLLVKVLSAGVVAIAIGTCLALAGDDLEVGGRVEVTEPYVVGCATQRGYAESVQLAAEGGDPRAAGGCIHIAKEQAGKIREVDVGLVRVDFDTGVSMWVAVEHIDAR